ncbi:uncharacterized protein [Panulirus ornatus]|uniref:uncharacterized protein isoform X2 n=1 Tax=Panulirus ornatus TaxID=150431 RepID=UPI003A897667
MIASRQMKLLVAMMLCLPLVICRPVEEVKTDATEPEVAKMEVADHEEETKVDEAEPEEANEETTEAPVEMDDDRFPRSHSHRLTPTVQVTGIREPLFSFGPGNEVPIATLRFFTQPFPASKAEREHAYFGNVVLVAPLHAHHVVQNELYFDTFDHAQIILGYEKGRKLAHLPPHFFKSLRPYFPFFSLD